MSEQSAPYGPYGNIPARVDELEKVKLALIDRIDRQDARFAGLEAKMDQLSREMHIIVEMVADQGEQMKTMLQILNDRLPPKEQ